MRRARTAATVATALPATLLPVDRELILFDAWGGRYNDHPRALHERMLSQGLPGRHLWVSRGPLTNGTPFVRPLTVAHIASLQRAGIVITNSHLPGFYRKRRATWVLQTWHGSGAMKRIGFDLREVRGRHHTDYLRTLERDVKRWDLLLATSPRSIAIRRRAFHYEGPVLRSGSPRNDRLVNAGDCQRMEVRERLGLQPGDKLALYAPTYRDDGSDDWMPTALERLSCSLSPEWRVAVHLHESSSWRGGRWGPRLLDGHVVSDIIELCLAADVLVTDYSSLMFDFLLTDRPIVLFAPDLDHYRDAVRGFYIDYEREAPGAIVRSLEDLADAVSAPDTPEAARHRQQAREIWLPWDDGHATERVVNAIYRRLELAENMTAEVT